MADPEIAVASPPVYVLYIFGVCLVAGIVRTLSRWTVLHHTVIMFGFGALFGYLCREYSAVHDHLNIDFLTSARLLQVHTLLLPLVIMEYLFSMDPRVFLSCSPLAVMTVILDYLLTLLFQGAFVFFFLNFYEVPWTPVKTILIYLLMGSLTSVTDTSYAVNTFFKMGSYWVLVKLMEIKRVISLVGACVIYIFVVYVNELNYDIGWHNIIVFLVLQFFACPALGWMTAQIMIFWLGRLYNDICVEITVSIAAGYVLYYFGTIEITEKPMVSAIAVVVYALLLNNRRTCFSLGLDTYLYKLLRILAYVVKTVIFTIAGFLITHEDFLKFGSGNPIIFVPHVLISFTLYSWCMLSRGIVCALLSPMLRRCGYRLSWQELSTMVFCNVSGTVCQITGVASFNKALVGLFFNDRRIQYLIMFHLGNLAVIRSLVAGTLFSHVLLVLGMRHVSVSRFVAMNNALQKVQEEIKSSARTYKFDRFLADADWETVYEFTNFDNPYKDISRYSVIGQSMNLDSEDLGDLRLNLLHAKRMSFWRQYEQGLLSLRALRILLEECYLAEWKVTTTSYDIGDQIRKHYNAKSKSMFNLIHILKQKFENMQEVRRLIIEQLAQAVRGKWKTLVFKIGLHMSLEIILIIAVLFMCVVSILILVYESTCPASWPPMLMHIFYFELNIAFMILITIYVLLKLYIFKWRYLVLFGSIFNISLIIVGWIDVGLDKVVVFSPTKICDELFHTEWAVTVRLVFHKFFLVYRCMRLFILLEDKTYFIVHTMKKRMQLQLQLGYDVGKAYVYCKEDIYHTAGEFIAQASTLEEIRKELQSSRVQLMRELATVQKKHPGIVVSVKSQEACRRILHVAKETVNQLQRNGRVDSYEAAMLDEMIKLRLKRLNQIPAQIEMPSVEIMISKLPWVNGNETLMGFLVFNSKMFNMAEGESVDFDFDPTAGIYILISGLIRVNWLIGEPYGKLLQATHASSESSMHSSGKMQLHDYMSTGSTFGELALLTENPIAIDAVCETSVLMYHVQYESIRTALDWVTEEPSLEWRLWLIAALRLSVPLLKALPGYYNASLEDLKVITDQGTLIVQSLENHTQDGSNEQKFDLGRHGAGHVILIHGIAKKSGEGETFVGPIIIPPDNNDLVFSSIFCDVYVLFIVPHKSGGTAGFVYSVSASELSTAVEPSKEVTTGQVPLPRPAVARKRARNMSLSVSTSPGQTHRAMLSTQPLRFIGENADETDESDTNEELQEEIGETQENLTTSSSVLVSPQIIQSDLTPISPSGKPAEKTESIIEEKTESIIEEASLTEVSEVSAPKSVVMSEQTTQEKPHETVAKEPEESEPTEMISTPNVSTVVDVVPRRSSSEIIRRPPWTEAWKHIDPPQITLTVNKDSQRRTSVQHTRITTPTKDKKDGPGSGKESLGGSASASVQRQVTDSSTTPPTTDVNKKNENVNSSTNNSSSSNNNNNKILRLYPRESEPRTSMHPTSNKRTTVLSVPLRSNTSDQGSQLSIFQLREESKYRTTEEESGESTCMWPYAAFAESNEQRGMLHSPGDETSDTSTVEDGELGQSVDIVASNLLTNCKSFDDYKTDSESSLCDRLAGKATSAATRDRNSWMLDLQRQPAAVPSNSVAQPNDLTGVTLTTVHSSDKSPAVHYIGSNMSEVLAENVATKPERTNTVVKANEVAYGYDAVNDVLFTSQAKSEQSGAWASAKSKLPVSKIFDIAASKQCRAAAKGHERAKQPTKTVAKSPDSIRNGSATISSRRSSRESKSVRNVAASFANNSKGRSTVEKHIQPARYVEPRRHASSTLGSDADGGFVAESRNPSLHRGIGSTAKPVIGRDSRERSGTTDVRTLRAPAGSMCMVDLSKTVDSEQSDSCVDST